MKRLSFFIVILFAQTANIYSNPEGCADLIVFSYNRPLQLFAFLESVEKYITGIRTTSVVYRVSNDAFDKAYTMVSTRFPHTKFIKQSIDNPQADFKLKTMDVLSVSRCNYILFGVDDIIVKDYIDLTECTQVLDRTKAYGFFLRLGENLNFCYPVNQPQSIPSSLQEIASGIYRWNLAHSQYDWAYPNNLDMTLYRKDEIMPIISCLNFSSPNTFEGQWAGVAHLNKLGLCYKNSKIVNVPLNIVQNDFKNRHMNFLTAQDMLTIFYIGLKMNINQFHNIDNKSAHVDFEPTFILNKWLIEKRKQ